MPQLLLDIQVPHTNTQDSLGGIQTGVLASTLFDDCTFADCSRIGTLGGYTGRFTADLCPDSGMIQEVSFNLLSLNDALGFSDFVSDLAGWLPVTREEYAVSGGRGAVSYFRDVSGRLRTLSYADRDTNPRNGGFTWIMAYSTAAISCGSPTVVPEFPQVLGTDHTIENVPVPTPNRPTPVANPQQPCDEFGYHSCSGK